MNRTAESCPEVATKDEKLEEHFTDWPKFMVSRFHWYDIITDIYGNKEFSNQHSPLVR